MPKIGTENGTWTFQIYKNAIKKEYLATTFNMEMITLY